MPIAIGNHILVANKGIVEQNAAAESIDFDPADAYVPWTIGSPSMNKARGCSADAILRTEGLDLPLFANAGGGEVLVCGWPENLHFAGSEEPVPEPSGPRRLGLSTWSS